MTEPHREMLAAVLDTHFDELTSAIAGGRRLAPAAVRELIDAMPMDAARAAEASLVDAVLYEDELATHLGTPGEKPGDGVIAAPLVTWREAIRWLRRPLRRTTRQVIGVVALEGMIVTGHSRRVPAPLPIPFLEATAGAETIAQALRRAEADRRVAAVIFYVETPGGSALASDLIAHEIRRLRQRKPVVVLMGGQATSGGYYVSALANHIVARPTTLTGSIGIWGGKFVLRGLYAKLGVGSEAVQRGAMAGLYAEAAPFSDEERARIRRDLGESYARFRRLVAEGRGMTEERVEEIARGRVWSGARALEIGLVDQLGDYETALTKAKELAGLDTQREYTVVPIRAGRQALLPPPFPATGAGWQELRTILRELAQERAWALAPWIVRVGG